MTQGKFDILCIMGDKNKKKNILINKKLKTLLAIHNNIIAILKIAHKQR